MDLSEIGSMDAIIRTPESPKTRKRVSGGSATGLVAGSTSRATPTTPTTTCAGVDAGHAFCVGLGTFFFAKIFLYPVNWDKT